MPIAGPPIRDGWVTIDRDRVVALGRRAAAEPRVREVDLGASAILPGLVNAHTHLELSHLRRRVPPSSEFVPWVRDVIRAQRQQADPGGSEVLEGVRAGIREAVASGTALVGDVTNTLMTFAPLVDSELAGVVFYELIRFNAPDPAGLVEQAIRTIDALPPAERVRVSLAAHAPYSVAPLVFRAIQRAAAQHPFVPWSVHLAESAAEDEFIRSAGGPWRRLLEDLGAWDPAWVAPGVSPVQYLDDAGMLKPRLLAVHGVRMSGADLARLAANGTTLVTCPRSNGHTGAGAPPIRAFYQSGVRVAVGTDSLASVPDLNVFAELAALRALAPSVPAAVLLDSATRQGARALGFEDGYGTIEPGKVGRLLAVSVPGDVDDVEEYLVRGIEPADVRWISEHL